MGFPAGETDAAEVGAIAAPGELQNGLNRARYPARRAFAKRSNHRELQYTPGLCYDYGCSHPC